jgi:hypothetical protein
MEQPYLCCVGWLMAGERGYATVDHSCPQKPGMLLYARASWICFCLMLLVCRSSGRNTINMSCGAWVCKAERQE